MDLEKRQSTTRLAKFHAYPAMVADNLAMELAAKFVSPGSRVLDPFCGSGRLLFAAAEVQGSFIGVDVNPLACLVVRAKAAQVEPAVIEKLISDLDSARSGTGSGSLVFREHRKVEWYPHSVRRELGQILRWINSLRLEKPEKLVVAVALSGAAREASFARGGRWKLHRISAEKRGLHAVSAWDAFERRLRGYLNEVSTGRPLLGKVETVCGNAQYFMNESNWRKSQFPVDLVLTSPPYGDSKTTVQYGAASSLCLDVVSQIDGLEDVYVSGAEIDGKCLGGLFCGSEKTVEVDDIRKYWAGARNCKRGILVRRFLRDFGKTFCNVKGLLGPTGRVVLVLGRRSVGGYRVKLDLFAKDCLERQGLKLDQYDRKVLRHKRMPKTINRFGRCRDACLRRKGTTKTMEEEIILTFRNTG